MSQHSSDNQSIPTVILVSDANNVPKKKRVPKRLPIFDVEIPWLKIAIVGSGAWVFALLILGLYSLAQGDRPGVGDVELLAKVPANVERPRPAPAAVEIKEEGVPAAKERAMENPLPAKKGVAAPKEDQEDLGLLPGRNEPFVECARIGTDVRFHKNPADAFLTARKEKKLVFVMHLSGNLEDRDFT